jgi:UDP-GlcNAc:undecaprenyl-phosphate GlcNAc-1-phosphate transferase
MRWSDAFAVAAVTFVPAMLLSRLLMPVAARLARATGMVAPVRADRLHREPRPYGGGIAMGATVACLGLLAFLLLPRFIEEDVYTELGFWGSALMQIACDAPAMPAIGAGAFLFLLLGLVDDWHALAPCAKLAVQMLAACLAVLGLGLKATVWLEIRGLPEAISVLWIVAVVNAYNMLDHADGVAGAVGVASLAALALGQFVVDEYLVAGTALVAAGALAGFLAYNAPPAQLFMGDAGSMLIGYLLAGLTMAGRYYYPDLGTSKWVVLVPLALLAVPLFDMVCVVAARLWRRQNPMKGDATSHLAHRMLARGWSPRGIVAFAAGATAVTGAASMSMYFLSGPALAAPWLVVAAVLAAMLLVRRPPHAEAAR